MRPTRHFALSALTTATTTTITIAALLFSAAPGRAQSVGGLNFTLDQPTVTVIVGVPEVVTFSGTITNGGTGDASLDTLNLNFDNLDSLVNLSPDDETPFFVNAPPTLSAGDSFHGELFTVSYSGAGTPLSVYSGMVTLQFDADGTIGNTLSQPFSVTVQAPLNGGSVAAPEPGCLALMGGLLTLGAPIVAVYRYRRAI